MWSFYSLLEGATERKLCHSPPFEIPFLIILFMAKFISGRKPWSILHLVHAKAMTVVDYVKYQKLSSVCTCTPVALCCRSVAAFYTPVYMMTPDYWRFRRACKTVHAFSLDVIRKRRAVLESGKVPHTA